MVLLLFLEVSESVVRRRVAFSYMRRQMIIPCPVLLAHCLSFELPLIFCSVNSSVERVSHHLLPRQQHCAACRWTRFIDLNRCSIRSRTISMSLSSKTINCHQLDWGWTRTNLFPSPSWCIITEYTHELLFEYGVDNWTRINYSFELFVSTEINNTLLHVWRKHRCIFVAKKERTTAHVFLV